MYPPPGQICIIVLLHVVRGKTYSHQKKKKKKIEEDKFGQFMLSATKAIEEVNQEPVAKVDDLLTFTR